MVSWGGGGFAFAGLPASAGAGWFRLGGGGFGLETSAGALAGGALTGGAAGTAPAMGGGALTKRPLDSQTPKHVVSTTWAGGDLTEVPLDWAGGALTGGETGSRHGGGSSRSSEGRLAWVPSACGPWFESRLSTAAVTAATIFSASLAFAWPATSAPSRGPSFAATAAMLLLAP